MKKKILILCVSILFILIVCSGCTQNKQDSISKTNLEKSVSYYSEDTEEFNNLNEENTKKLFILKKHMLRKSIPCRGVRRGLMIGRHL